MIKSVCGYCGVGCGIEFEESKLIGDLSYPINEGLVCAKGVSELHSIQTPTRLLRPKIRTSIEEEYKESSWEDAISLIATKIKATTPNRIAFYLSGQLMSEDYYIANKLAKGFIGTPNVDTNSRTCMASAVVAYKKIFGIDYVPVRMEDVESANLLIVAGANPAEAHVVFWNKVKKLKKNGLKVVVIDPRYTESAKNADLYLPIKPNSDIDFFNLVAMRLILDNQIDEEFLYKHCNDFDSYKKELLKLPKTKLLKRTGLTKEQFEEFIKMFYENQNTISAWTMGLNQSSQGVEKNIALINLHLLSGKMSKKGNGPFSLTGQPNAMGGREVGGLATMLAVHLDYNEENIAKVNQFWKTSKVPKGNGFTAVEIFHEALKGNIDCLIICHTDPIYHLPNRHKMEKAIQKIPFVVEINAYNNSETSQFAHLKLPATPWGEKEGTQTNMDRTITKQEILTRKSIDCKDDWMVFKLLADALGYGGKFAYEKPEDIFKEYQEMCKLSHDGHLDIYKTSYQELTKKPFVWGEGLFDTNEFFTPNKKANLFCVSNKTLSEKPNKIYPFVLLTGRTRDQWHSGTKTGFVENLKKFKPENFVEIHPLDGVEFGIKDGSRVWIQSPRGQIESYAKYNEGIMRKTVFIPITNKKINYLTDDLLDLSSKEPDYNHSVVRIVSYFQ